MAKESKRSQTKPKTYSSHLIEPASDLRRIIEELKDRRQRMMDEGIRSLNGISPHKRASGRNPLRPWVGCKSRFQPQSRLVGTNLPSIRH
jgi:hypothetical protein